MLKTVILISAVCVIIAGVIAIAINYNSWGNLAGDAITNKEMAMQIGRELLAEYFEDTCFLDPELPMGAEEKNGVWKVYNLKEDKSFGGVAYVEFYKKDGTVLKFQLDD